MLKNIFYTLLIGVLLSSCREEIEQASESIELTSWTVEALRQKALEQVDSSNWDKETLVQDIETFIKYGEVFKEFALNKSPFPVAEYDYAVSAIPFTIEMDSTFFNGVRIGEYESFESDKIIDKLTLIVLTNDKAAATSTLIESRNYPYLTAQGYFNVVNNEFEWIFSASPDGYATLLFNMKLFDLRFGETIIIYPQKDFSFLYDQINDSPNNYADFEAFKSSILDNKRVQNQLKSEANIR